MDNVVDLGGTVLKSLLSLLSRGVASDVNIALLDDDELAVNLVGNVVDLLAGGGVSWGGTMGCTSGRGP